MTLIMFGGLFLFLALKVPLAFATGAIALITGYIIMGARIFPIFSSSVYDIVTTYVYVALPMFIFMGSVLERSGISDDLYEVIYQWLAPVRGSLAIATVAGATILSAMIGNMGAVVVSMGVIAFPAMQARGYDNKLTMGSIMAGGSLGILIPPSVLLIILGLWAGISVRALFLAAIGPGFLLAFLHAAYVFVRCNINPELGPALSKEERVPIIEKVKKLKGVILPFALIAFVMGSIILGIASPTEASGMGAFGSLVCAAIHRRLNWQMIREVCLATLRLSAMIMWISFGAIMFVYVYNYLGGVEFVTNLMLAIPAEPWVVLIIMMVIILLLGMIIEWIGIIMLVTPIFVPIAQELGFDPLWFATLMAVNLQMDVLTPPFGYALFYMKGVAPKGTMTIDIYRAAIPFVFIQLLCLILVMAFPKIATWLPSIF